MTKMTGSSSDDGLGGTNIALCEGISPSPLKAIESSNIVFILAAIFLCAYFLRIYLSKLLSSYYLKQHSDHRTTKLVLSSSSDQGFGGCKYDVFISFRGVDTRNNFVSHLYYALCRKKIEAYKDDEKLPKGDEISPSLLEAIESSKISIVVLSENYATSSWCLDELVHILKCKRERGQIVLPVFYAVNPSDVRRQKESYASAFVKHEKRFKDDMEKVLRWRLALEEIGNLSGWDSNENRPESELVDKIAHDILSKLQKLSSAFGNEVFRNLVGMEKRFKNFELLLRIDSPDVRVIGIWGMGGIGKSTLAEIVLKQLWYRFDSCFCEDVSNEVKRHGLPNIKKKLYASLLNENDVNMNNSFNNVRLRRARVLIILDNVDDDEQLEKLIGVSEETKTRFGEGSRIILTSRDNKLLKERADEIYEVCALDSYEANELFSRNAFGRDSSKRTDYGELSKRIEDYAGGNPLALKVLGSHLHSRSVKEWESELSKLRKSPDEKVQKVLKISYDALDHVVQSIFLDIACFLKGEDREFIENILEGDSHISISILIEKSLITTNSCKIWMHDLIQEMAWEVVRQESIELGKRSRLWDAQDVYSVLKRNKGSASVKGMCLDLSKISNDLCLSSTVFEALENLRFLKIYNSHFSQEKFVYFHQGLDCLPDSLRYLHWERYPLRSLPSAFEPQNLVKLSMSGCKLEKLWNGVQHLGNLKHIDLCWSEDLIELPDLSRAPRLERVDLFMCKRLCRFPKISSNQLKILEMNNTGVEVFDPSLESAENLEIVNLGGSQRLTSFPMLPRNVRKLDLHACVIRFAWPVLLGLHSLTELRMCCCGISDIPESFNLLSSLETLDMEQNDFERIPSSIKQMNTLKRLNISECKNLESLPDLPSSLICLEARCCESLRMMSVCGLTSLERIDASECKSLEEFIIEEPGCTSLEEFIIDEPGCTSLEEFGIDEKSGIRFSFENCLKLKQDSQDNICTLFQRQTFRKETAFHRDIELIDELDNWAYYCGNEIPKWFTCESEGSSIHNISLGHNVIGISVSVVHELEGPKCFTDLLTDLNLRIWSGATKLMDCSLPQASFDINEERLGPHVYMWHSYLDEDEKELLDNVTEPSFEFKLADYYSQAEIKIKKIGIRLIYLEEVEEFNFYSHKADQTSPKPDEAPYSRRLRFAKFYCGSVVVPCCNN